MDITILEEYASMLEGIASEMRTIVASVQARTLTATQVQTTYEPAVTKSNVVSESFTEPRALTTVHFRPNLDSQVQLKFVRKAFMAGDERVLLSGLVRKGVSTDIIVQSYEQAVEFVRSAD